MAMDEGRATRIRDLKQTRPDLTWGDIADKVGVTERSALDWQRTGGISHPNCKKLAKVFDVDPDWLWSGADRGETPDLMGALNGEGSQLDRIEARLEEIIGLLVGGGPAEVVEEAARIAAAQRQGAEAQRRTRASRKAS